MLLSQQLLLSIYMNQDSVLHLKGHLKPVNISTEPMGAAILIRKLQFTDQICTSGYGWLTHC